MQGFLILVLVGVTLSFPLFPYNTPSATVSDCSRSDDCCNDNIHLQGIFPYFGVEYTAYGVSSNGLIAWGNNCNTSYIDLPITPNLAVYFNDADFRSKTS